MNATFSLRRNEQADVSQTANGVITTSQYDGLNHLTRLTHAKNGNTLADFQYQFSAVSSITQMIDRLTAVTHPNQTNESYTLEDPVSGRLLTRVRANAMSFSQEPND